MANVSNNDSNKRNTNTTNTGASNMLNTDTVPPEPITLPGAADPTPPPTQYGGVAGLDGQYVSTGTSPNNPDTPYSEKHLGQVFGRDFNEYVNTSGSSTGNYKGLGYYAHDGTVASLLKVENEERNKLGDTNPDNYVGYTPEQLVQLAISMGVDPERLNYNAARSFMSDDPNYVYSNRDVVEGGAGADEFWLNDGALDMLRIAQQNYANAETQEERDYWHTVGEKIRAGMGYSGGTDGTLYLTHGDLGLTKGSSGSSGTGVRLTPGSPGKKQQSADAGFVNSGSDLKGLLDAWQQAALQQSNGKIDYAVAKAVADLERALADAQPQFKEQAETVAREERQALDNSALYAEMRGDKGGIGQEQYNSIQNTAAQNHLAVQQAQTKLATDTQRQIADLRAQGEFEKADAALQITQQYLQQLVGIEQWAAEYNLSTAQFQESIRQWEAEYQLAMQQLQTSQNQWQQEFAFQQQQYANSLNQWQQEFDYGKQSDLANVGWALLESGIPLSEEQMSAMGIDPGQASQILMQQQLEAALKNNGSGTPVVNDVTMSLTTAKELAKNGIFSEQVLAVLRKNGYDDAALSKIYGYVPETGLPTGGEVPTTDPTVIEEREAFQYIDEKSVIALGLGSISYQQLKKMEADGVILIFDMGDQIGVTWAPGWTKEKYKQRYG